ncbi:hypothetical protein [Solirubrobacter ginsenosidimutans]|nr:hypothetical protein [Solirubrobacter ginsenosidimutans]
MLGSSALLASVLLHRSAPMAAAQSKPWDDVAYWAFADRMQDQLDRHWDGRYYTPTKATVNSNLLLTHAAAALAGHDGPARRDDRAKTLIKALCEGPAWVTKPTDSSQGHKPGWRDGIAGGGIQHLVVDTEIAWPLMIAWQARDALGLDQATADLIADRIISTTKGSFWKWPTLRLNQINWYTRMYVAAATVGGDRKDLQNQLLEQVRRFVDGVRKPMAGATVSNLGGGYRFHYLPGAVERHKYNLDSAEYANIVLGFLVAYKQARDAGMPPLDSARAEVVRAWSERVLSGYWTHAGYLNWDTGLGFKRWHQGKKLGLSQAALLGIAVCPELAPNQSWAKHLLDRGFELFDRWTQRDRGLPPANAFSVPSIDDDEASQVLAAARVQANAAQAVLYGLGKARSEEPPPLYAYDPDVGRLAITTPTYNTAIVAVSRDAFPYGGVDIARLFDGQQDVAGGVGGRPPASFGVVVRSGGKMIAASQHAVAGGSTDPLELLEAPRGIGNNPQPFPHRPYAGAFKMLRVRGTARANGIAIQTTHRFEATFIETEWRVTGAGGKVIEAIFPSWGSRAKVTAVNRRGERRAVTDGMSLRDVDWFHVESEQTGYVVVVEGGKSATKPRPSKQSSAPKPGPTLTIRASGTTIKARIAPAKTVDEARAIAVQLVG